jgi:hypothetical protein
VMLGGCPRLIRSTGLPATEERAGSRAQGPWRSSG